MPFSTRIIALFAAVALAIPASLPVAPVADAYSQLCVFQKGIFLADVHVEFKRRSAGPNYADPDASSEFDIVTRSHHVANDLNNSSWTGRGAGKRRYGTGPSYSRHVRDCWSREQLGNPQPGEVFSVRVKAVAGKTTYCRLGPERSLLDNGDKAWHRVFTWSDSRSAIVFDIVGQTLDPLCMLHSHAKPKDNDSIVLTGVAQRSRYLWQGCLEGSEGFRRASCYSWRPRFKGDGNIRRAIIYTHIFDYYFDRTRESVQGGKHIRYDGDPAYFFAKLGKEAHLASVARRGADLNKAGDFGIPLQMVARNNRPDLGRILLGLDPHVPPENPLFNKADVDLMHRGTAALHDAADLLHNEVARMLVREGRASVDLLSGNPVNIPEILTEAGVPEAAIAGATRERGLRPLEIALRHIDPEKKEAQTEMFRMLTEARADTYSDMTPLRLADAADMNPEIMRYLFRDNLRRAIKRGDSNRLRALVAMVNHSVTRSGRRFPNWADVNQEFDGSAPVLRFADFNPNARDGRGGAEASRAEDRGPAILRTFQMDYPEGAVPLAEMKGINLDAADSEGRRPLHLAATVEHLDAMRALLENGADKEAKADNGETPLHLSARLDRLAAAALLMEVGADLNAADSEGRRPLHLAVTEGHLDAMRALLENGADKEAKADNGETALHLAARLDRPAGVALLMEVGADLAATDAEGRTPLDAAVLGGHHEIETTLLAAGAPRGVTDVGDRAVTQRRGRDEGTGLHEFARTGDAERMRTALAQQADVNARNNRGRTALLAAILADSDNLPDIVEQLLRAGADPRADDGVHTPAVVATRRNRGDILRLLLDYGVDPDSGNPHRNNLPLVAEAVFANAPEALAALGARGADMNIRADGRLVGGEIYPGELDMLHHAAHAGYAGVIRELMRGGATIGRPEADGLWPAGRAAKRKHDAALYEFMSAKLAIDTNLIARVMRAEPELFPISRLSGGTGWQGNQGLRPGETPSVDYIIDFIRENPDAERKFALLFRRNDGTSPDPNRRNANGETALHHAVFHSLAATRELFVRDPFQHWRADPNIQDANGHPPLYWALGAAKPKNGTRMEIVEMLLEREADPNLQNNNGQAALHQAARWARPEFFPLLLRYGADPNQKDAAGRTPLEVAKDDETREALALATVDKADLSGETGLMRAAAAGDNAEMERLIAAGADVNARDEEGNTALLRGILAGHSSLDWVRTLVEAGAEFFRVNQAGDTPLTAASARGMRDIAEILTDGGARPDYARRDGWTPLLLAATRGAPDGVIDERQGAGENRVCYRNSDGAVVCDRVADYVGTFRALSRTPGADLDAAGPDGLAPAHIAALAGDAEMMRAVADSSADLSRAVSGGRHAGKTPLHLALINGYFSVVTALLSGGLELEDGGRQLMRTAARGGSADFLRALLDGGATRSPSYYSPDLNSEMGQILGEYGVWDALIEEDDQMGKPLGVALLHRAAMRNDRAEMAERLLGWGAKADVEDKDGNTPLQTAAASGSDEIVPILLRGGADASRVRAESALGNLPPEIFLALLAAGMKIENPGTANAEGETMLHQAARLGSMDVFLAIAELADDLSVASGSGKTPLEVAREAGAEEIARYLEEQTAER